MSQTTTRRGTNFETMSDAELARHIADGESLALSAAHRLYASKVLAVATKVVRDPDLAADVTQEVFERLWHRTDRFDPDRGSLATFLAVDAQGRSIDLIRSRNASKTRELADIVQRSGETSAGTEEQAMQSIDAERIRRTLESLPSEQRIPITLAYFEGISYRQVAERLRTPEGTVKSRIRAGLRTLGGSLGDLAPAA